MGLMPEFFPTWSWVRIDAFIALTRQTYVLKAFQGYKTPLYTLRRKKLLWRTRRSDAKGPSIGSSARSHQAPLLV